MTSTQLYDKNKNAIFPNTHASLVTETLDNDVLTAIDNLRKNIGTLSSDIEYLKENGCGGSSGGGGTVVVQPAVNVSIKNFPSQLSGTINLFEYLNYFNTSSPYVTFTYSNIEGNPTTYSLELDIYDTEELIQHSDKIRDGEETTYHFKLPDTITPGVKTITAKVTVGGITGSTSKSFTAKVPSMLIFSDATKENMEDFSISNPTNSELILSDLSGQYTSNGKFLWIVTTEKLKKLTVGAISANYELITITDSTYRINYNCYRALVKPDKGIILNIEVA